MNADPDVDACPCTTCRRRRMEEHLKTACSLLAIIVFFVVPAVIGIVLLSDHLLGIPK